MTELLCEQITERLQSHVRSHLSEAWGDFVNPSEWANDSSSFGWSGGYNASSSFLGTLPTSLTDRKDGAFWPIFRTTTELSQIRGECRNVSSISSTGVGAVEALSRYIFGKGFEYAADANDMPRGVRMDPTTLALLVEEVQVVIDEFTEQNKWTNCYGALDEEIHGRLREDGEAAFMLESRLAPGGYARSASSIGVKARTVEPDQIVAPRDSYALDRWLGYADSRPTSWSFGVHTSRDDTDEPLGFHVVYPSDSGRYDYVPAIVGHPANPTKTMVFAKRNTPRTVKRGLSDFLPITGDVGRAAKLKRNMADAAALQAAIAWIVENPANVSAPVAGGASSIVSLVGQHNLRTTTGTKQIDANAYPSKSILTTPAGRKYLPGPMGAERNNGFIEVYDLVLRSIGQRWLMPEYMISGDASNANYASSLVSESPFVKARENDQQGLVGVFCETLWKVIQLYERAGRFKRFVPDFQMLKRLVNVVITPPEVASRDPVALTNTLVIQKQNGWIDDRMAQNKLGIDPEQVEVVGTQASSEATAVHGADGKPVAGGPANAPGAEHIGLNIQQINKVNKLRDRYLAAYKAGEADEKTTRMQLDSLGIPADKIDAWMDKDTGNDPVDQPETTPPGTTPPEADPATTPQVTESRRTPHAHEMISLWESYP